jgi:biotin carboxyl carrier protein
MARIEVAAEVTGTTWKVEAEVGSQVEADDVLLIVESMKMEIPVTAPQAGRVVELKVAKGDAVEEGQVVAILEGA